MTIVSAIIDWPGIRANAQHVGIREAARQAARNLSTLERERFVFRVLKRAAREHWTAPVVRQSPVASEIVLSSNVLTGSDAAKHTLAELEGHTRTTLAKYAKNAAGAIHKSVHPTKWTKEAHEIAKTMAIVHRQGEHGNAPGFSLNILNMGSLGVEVKAPDAET